jgi:hypothetical protein
MKSRFGSNYSSLGILLGLISVLGFPGWIYANDHEDCAGLAHLKAGDTCCNQDEPSLPFTKCLGTDATPVNTDRGCPYDGKSEHKHWRLYTCPIEKKLNPSSSL